MLLESQKFLFDDFLLDSGEKVLLRNGKPIGITPKAFELLLTLVRNHGHLVEKNDLIKAVWADSFVEEANLPFTIGILRKALGDDAQNPHFIETVPKRGYRFIAPVSTSADGEHPDATFTAGADPSPTSARKNSFGLPPYGIPMIVVILICALAVVFATFSRKEPSAPLLTAPLAAEKLPTLGNSEFAAISPDGKYAAFTDDSGGNRSVWMRKLDSGENIQVVPPSNHVYMGLVFSNTGDSLFFVRMADSSHALPTLYRVGAFGGLPVKILDNVIRSIDLSSDDRQIAFIRCKYRKTDFCSVYIADSTGENERLLFTSQDDAHIRVVEFSPDNRSLVFARGRTKNEANDFGLVEIDVETGNQREVFSERFYDIRNLEWLPNGSGLLFTANEHIDGKFSIWAAGLTEGSPTRATKDIVSYSEVSLDAAGSRAIAVQKEPDFRLNASLGGITKTLANARDVAFSNDGRILYSTFDGEIWIVDADGGGQRQLTNNTFAEGTPRFSPDARTIYFASNEGGLRHIWRMNTDGTDRKKITSTVGGDLISVSADGASIYYLSSTEILHRVSPDGGPEELVHEKRLLHPAISPDGSLIAFFVLEDEFKIAVMRTDNKERVKTFGLGRNRDFVQQVAWSGDGRTLYYVAETDARNFVWRQPLDVEHPARLADLGIGSIRSFAIRPDREDFAYVSGKWNFDVVFINGLG